MRLAREEAKQAEKEAKELASIIRIGSLKLELNEIRSNVVGAQLGQEAIKTSLIAGAIGLVLVGIFMMIVYALPGVIAMISLAIYTGLELIMLNAFDLTLTLPGIAGIILSLIFHFGKKIFKRSHQNWFPEGIIRNCGW